MVQFFKGHQAKSNCEILSLHFEISRENSKIAIYFACCPLKRLRDRVGIIVSVQFADLFFIFSPFFLFFSQDTR